MRALRRYDDAEREARRGLAAEPGDADLLMELAAVLLAQRRGADGLAVAEAALTGAPQAERAHRIRAALLAQLGRHAEALHAGYTSVSLAPEEPWAALGYATVLQQAGRLADAQQVALRAVSLAPDEPAAHPRLADIASDRGDPGTARAAYQETLRLDPDNAAARHDLAVLDLNAHRQGDALRGLVEAGRLDPSIPVVLDNVGAVLWRLSWRVRICLLVAAFLVIGTSGADPEVRGVLGRVTAALVLVAAAGIAWWAGRDLPSQAGPVVRAALRADRPLAVTVGALGLCLLTYAAVAVTGLGELAVFVWLVLALLAALA
ncbi:MAG: tetratricopeptide repeat protein, partial [Pseudonocardia sp.]|nr:tetratricopeptide repeat protein [Pseudonocardia sp.]